MKNIIGYQVHETVEGEPIEQVLVLRKGPGLPEAGILGWPDYPDEARSLFSDRKSARTAIVRTDHYRLAFAAGLHPDKQFCKVVPVKMA